MVVGRNLLARSGAVALLTVLFLCMMGLPAQACFGPKLYIGVDAVPEQRFLHALVALYVKEKTGVEMEAVAVSTAQAGAELAAQRLDLAFAPPAGNDAVLLAPNGLPHLYVAPRVRDDLQFTTVVPALRKLDRLLAAVDVRAQVEAVARGESPAAVARTFLNRQGWL
jgi:hypothetical protein